MPKFQTEVAHQLGKDQAQQRLQSFSEDVRQKFAGHVTEMVENWDEEGNLQFGFRVLGLKIDGALIIYEELVIVDGNLPFAAVAFKGKIENDIKMQLTEALG